ncbi:MAG: hypothetical protein J6X77_01290 [Bacteroidales bacterium]|nr:hypothetical protein [Bacteroidales bacterium]
MKKVIVVLALIFVSYGAFAQSLKFADEEVLRCALHSGDRNGDGVLSKVEADSLTVLNLTSYRIHMFQVKTYEDLQKFPHLKKVWLGESTLPLIDLSFNYELEMVAVQSDELKTLVLAVGCYPQLITPTREGSLVVKRVRSSADPNSIWYL